MACLPCQQQSVKFAQSVDRRIAVAGFESDISSMAALLIGLLIVGLTAALVVAIAACLRMQRSVADTRSRLGAYLPQSTVAAILHRRDDQPRARYYPAATVVVMRIGAFSALIERLTPHAALRYINECHLLCGTAVHRNGGIIERFLEDGLVAVFGIDPAHRADHEYNGLRSGLEASRMVAAMKPRWESEGRRPFRISVGAHTGSLIAGDVGFGAQRTYALVGGTVVIAQQLQRLAEEINSSLLTSGNTFAQVRDRFVFLPVKQIPLRNMHETHEAYIVRSLAMGELVEELGLPPLSILATQVADESEFHDIEEAPREEAIWQRLYAHPVSPRLLDAGRDDTPVMPDPLRAQSSLDDGDGPPFGRTR